jgi:diguanylate cyclase (GGDEF)-like protein
MRQLSAAARMWIVAVLLGGACAIAIGIAQANQPEVRADLAEPSFWLLLIAACVAHAFPVIAPRHQAYHATQAFLMASVLVLAWPCVVLIIVAAHVAEWLRRPRPVYIQLYNIATYLIAAGASAAVVHASGVWPFQFGVDARGLVVALLAAAVMLLLNHGLTATVLWLARGIRPTDSGLFAVESLGLDGVLLVVGIGIGGLLTIQPLSILVTGSPLILIQRALRVASFESTSHHDGLTGLYNARHLQEALDIELRRARSNGQPTGLIVGVLDDMPSIVQRFGRATLDFLMLAVATRLQSTVREFDVVARVDEGGFGVLLPTLDAAATESVARRIGERLGDHPFSLPTTREAVLTSTSLAYAAVPPAPGANAAEVLTSLRTAVAKAALSGPSVITAVSLAMPSATAEPVAVAPDASLPVTSLPSSLGKPWSPPRRWLPAFQTVVCSLGLGLSVYVLFSQPLPEPRLAAGVIAVVALSELLAFELFDRSSFSVSFAPIVAAGLLGGPAATLLAVWSVALVRGVLRRSRWSRVAFNASAFTLAGIPATVVATGAGRFDLDSSELVPLAIGTALASTVYYLHTFLIAGALALDVGADPRQVWERNYRWLFPHYIVLGWMGLGLALATLQLGLLGAALFLAPLLAMRVVLKQYVERTAGAVHRLESANAELRSASELLQRRGEELTLLSDLGQLVAAEPRTEALPTLVVAQCVPALGEVCAVLWQSSRGIQRSVHAASNSASTELAQVIAARPLDEVQWLAEHFENAEAARGKVAQRDGADEISARQERLPGWAESAAGTWLATPLAGVDQALGWLLAWSASPPNADERARRLELMREVSQRLALVLERDALLEEAAEVEALRTVDRAKSDFIATTAHELRTPLTSLQGYTELLRGPVEPALRDRWLSIIHVEAAQLGQVVDQLLDVSRLDSGRFQAERREFELLDVVNSVALHFAQQVSLSGHRLVVEVPNPPRVYADPTQVERVLRNLVSNALKYSPDGGEVRIAAVERSSGEVEMCVQDYGLGIPAEWLGPVFDRFQRVERPERDSIRGTGLGLYIARQLVELNSGRIWATSEGPGRGSTFHVTMPVARRTG